MDKYDVCTCSHWYLEHYRGKHIEGKCGYCACEKFTSAVLKENPTARIVEEFIEALSDYSEQQRKGVFDQLKMFYCIWCGSDLDGGNKRCYCMRDD